MDWAAWPRVKAPVTEGNAKAAKIAMIEMTTRSSMRVNPERKYFLRAFKL